MLLSRLNPPFPSKREELRVQELATREQKEDWDEICQSLSVFPCKFEKCEMKRLFCSTRCVDQLEMAKEDNLRAQERSLPL